MAAGLVSSCLLNSGQRMPMMGCKYKYSTVLHIWQCLQIIAIKIDSQPVQFYIYAIYSLSLKSSYILLLLQYIV